MIRPPLLRTVLPALLASLWAFAPAPTVAADPADRPNILVLLVDDLGYGEIGEAGEARVPTPHIDSLAANGVRCTSGYVTAPYCSPSRAGLMTGRLQTRFGHEFNPVGASNLDPRAGLPLTEQTLADRLREAGYATALVGKWHLGGTAEQHPLERGFDEFFGFLHEGHYYVAPPYEGVTSFLRRRTLPAEASGTRYRDGRRIFTSHMGSDEPPYDADNPVLRGRQAIAEDAYLTDAFSREAVAVIERHQSRPFFLCLSYNAVHSPMQGADAYMRKFAAIEDVHRRVFAAMLAHLDDSVGTVLQALRERRLEERTLIFFLSDNGGPTRELTSSNHPLRGGKGDLYEGGIRVPFIVQWKGSLPAGREYAQPVLSTDLFATACAAAGVETPEKQRADSVNLLPYLRGERDGSPHETLYWRMGTQAALRHGDWKLVRNTRGRESAFELYDLKEDLSEQRNLAEQRPEIVKQLSDRWQAVDRQMSPPRWTREMTKAGR